MIRTILVLVILLINQQLFAQVKLNYYLPEDVSYNPEIPSPNKFVGHEIGEWHLTHDKLYYYMTELARISERATWEEYGRSYENRPLGQLIISSPENIKNLEQIRLQHVSLCDPDKSDHLDIQNMPVFIKLGYSVHGDESSASNSSVLVAYYLTAGEGQKINELLRNAVILIDPSLNPDGMQRHSTWVNYTKSLNNNPDENSWEFSEAWPGGRTNHYWFDLNRDYIMLQHPETVGRVRAFFKWRPNINTDHHEMGANLTFFFQPGIQSRINPLIPQENNALTFEIAKYHEKYLNKIGSLYYTDESYDDFYVGKGSAYPDIHGSIGILFEQAGVKGHLRETPSGLLSFPFAIRNQFNVSLSTIEAGINMRIKLLDFQKRFYKNTVSEADKHPVKAYVFSEPDDKARTIHFIKNLRENQIKVYGLARDISKNGIDFKAGNSYIVPLKQNEFWYIRSLFDTVKDFTDSTFYDISTWVLPMSFNIPYAAIPAEKDFRSLIGQEITSVPEINGRLIADRDAYAYLFEWNEYFTPKALYMLQDAGLKARVATEEFTSDDGSFRKKFSFGTILVQAENQSLSREEIYNLMEQVAVKCGITIYGVKTGLTPSGIDLGSTKFMVLQKPSVVMIVGNGIGSNQAGEIWHMFDTRYNIPLSLVTSTRISTADLDRYNVLIIAGSPDISGAGLENIRTWNKKGGTIIGFMNGNNWLQRNKIAEIDYIPESSLKKKEGRYIDMGNDRGAMALPGSIFEVRLDLTHPLCYGFTRPVMPVFKSGISSAKKVTNIYNNPVIYTDKPLLSGYCTQDNLDRIKGSAYVNIPGTRVISIYDNTNFRAIWFGTNKIFMNAVFFGQIIR